MLRTSAFTRAHVAPLTMSLFAGLVGCKGCGQKPAAEPPERFVDRSAPAILELSDLGAIARSRQAVVGMMAGLATQAQLDEATKAMSNDLGFDLTTVEGLAAAGLPDKGPMAVQLSEGGAMLVVPVIDETKLKAVVSKSVSARLGATSAERDANGVKLTVFSRAFGPDTVPVTTYAAKGGLAFIGFGRTSPEVVTAALSLPAESSIRNHPEYQALDKALGRQGVARVIAPSPGPLRDAILEALADRMPLQKETLKYNPKSAGAVLFADAKELRVDARVRLAEADLGQARAVFTQKGAIPASVGRIGGLPSFLYLEVSGEVRALLEAAGKEDPGFKQELEEGFVQLKEMTGVDAQKDLIEKFGGHGAIAVGLRDPALLADLEALRRNPFAAIWTMVGVSFTGANAKLYDDAMDKVMAGVPDVKREKQTAADGVVDVLEVPEPKATLHLARMKDAIILTNDGERLKEKADGSGILGGRAGFGAELRFGPVVAALGAVNPEAVSPGAGAIMARGIIEKARGVLARFDRARATMTLVEDGVAFEGRIVFAPPRS
ncbi:MAG: hypothetical protein HY791_21955 [Deltaproteobacteria bacterium]|nr:hypothetical protein [Deltaproteobacteria bacterium]